MATRVPTKRELVNGIVLRIRGRGAKLSDFTPIANFRILVEEMIVEPILLLFAGLVQAVQDWFLGSAKGAALDRRLADFGVLEAQRPPATIATGAVLFVGNAAVPTTIAPGTVVQTQSANGSPAKRYRVLPNPDRVDGLWAIDFEGDGVLANVAALEAGASGNAASNTIIASDSPIAGVASFSNPHPLIDGREVANDDEAFANFQAWIASRKRGSTAAITFDLLRYVDPTTLTRPVRSCAIVEWDATTLLDAAGTPVALKIFVDLAAGATVEAIQKVVDGTDLFTNPGLKSAGVRTAVVAASPVLLHVRARVVVDRGFNTNTVRQNVEDTIFGHIARLVVANRLSSGELVGQLVFARLVSAVQDVAGVLQVIFELPTGDLGAGIGIKFVPGNINVTATSVQ